MFPEYTTFKIFTKIFSDKKMFRVRDAQIDELVVKSDGVNETIK